MRQSPFKGNATFGVVWLGRKYDESGKRAESGRQLAFADHVCDRNASERAPEAEAKDVHPSIGRTPFLLAR